MVDMTIGRLWGVGYRWFYWFSLCWKNFSPTYNDVRFFFSIVRHERYFFQWRIFFSQEYICVLFSSRNQSAGHFFLKSPITPSKVKWTARKIHQTFGQLTDSDLSIISKGFWNNREQNSLGGREEFVSTYPNRESPYGRMDGRTVTSSPNFLGWIVYQILLHMVVRCARFTREEAPLWW